MSTPSTIGGYVLLPLPTTSQTSMSLYNAIYNAATCGKEIRAVIAGKTPISAITTVPTSTTATITLSLSNGDTASITSAGAYTYTST